MNDGFPAGAGAVSRAETAVPKPGHVKPAWLTVCTGGVPLQIELTDLISADAAGIEALQLLRSRGATLSGAPGYLQLQVR
jgi:hypothetical protein